MNPLSRAASLILRALRQATRAAQPPRPPSRGRARLDPAPPPAESSTYPGDYVGVPTMTYAPHPDGDPDPGEIVWCWVPFEDDHSQGKDRPVLLVGRDGHWVLGLPLTSKDHDRDAAQEARAGRDWVDIGTGAWDRGGRPSEVRVNRVVRIDPGTIRREGAVLDRDRFLAVADAVRRSLGSGH